MVQDISGHVSVYKSKSFMNHSIVEKRTFGMKYDLYAKKSHAMADGFGKTSASVQHNKKK